jgi:hypothetical protein
VAPFDLKKKIIKNKQKIVLIYIILPSFPAAPGFPEVPGRPYR